MAEISISERYQGDPLSKVRKYRCTDNGIAQEIIDTPKNKNSSDGTLALWPSILLTFRQVFLPHGYPSSVSPDYINYQFWDTVQAFSSSITGALATEAVMRGVGVGNQDASSLAAAMTWLLKSGSGMVGGIMFTWAKGTSLDYDNKKWRLFADVLNDLATLIDLITPLFPLPMIIWIFCCSSIARSLVGVAGGATRAAITQHQARANNSADVQAKDGSQETLVNLASLILSLGLLPLVSGNQVLVWSLFCVFTWIHVYANFRAVKSLEIETLNRSRLLIILNAWIKSRGKEVPSVKEANELENVILGLGLKDQGVGDGYRIQMGGSISDINDPSMGQLIRENCDKKYLISWNEEKRIGYVILHEGASSKDVIEAFSAAVTGRKSFPDFKWGKFQDALLGKGYNLDKVAIETGEWRANWQIHVKGDGDKKTD